LQEFIKGGGTLIVDAAGGKTAFAESADKALRLIFGDDANQLNEPLTEDNKLYTTGGKIDEISYRTFARGAMGGMKGPRLRGITKDGRLVCIYSPEDLSVGMVGEPVDGILGYSPATATELMRKILLLASGDTPVKPIVAAAAKTPVKVPAKPPAPKPAAPPAPKPTDQ
jgi:hypothetical protein